MVAAPRQIKARSNTGKQKAAYVFRMLEIKGFEPFDPIGRAYHQERVRHADGSWTDVQLTTDRSGKPITREMVAGELCDVTWWKGRASSQVCQRCTLADGTVRPIIRTVRAARVRADNRLPRLQDAGFWHPACLTVRLQKQGRYGHDIAPMPSVTRCKCPADSKGVVKHRHK